MLLLLLLIVKMFIIIINPLPYIYTVYTRQSNMQLFTSRQLSFYSFMATIFFNEECNGSH